MLNFEATFGRQSGFQRNDPDQPRRLLVLADFSGRQGAEPLRFRPIDIDSFDRVLKQQNVRLPLAPELATTGPILHSLDGFHPDEVFAAVPLFQSLGQSRRRLLDSTTFPDEVKHVLESIEKLRPLLSLTLPLASHDKGSISAAPHEPPTHPERPGAADEANLLDRLLDKPATVDQASEHQASAADQWIRNLVAPHIKSASEVGADHQQWVEIVDALMAEAMRFILHDPRFQQLESVWRSLGWLVSSVETDEQLQIVLCDVSKSRIGDELAAAAGDWKQTATFQQLVDQQHQFADGHGWDAWISLESYEASPQDLASLELLGHAAQTAGAALVASARPALVGCETSQAVTERTNWDEATTDQEANWQAFRQQPIAQGIGLIMPRVLLRLPYGAKTDAVEAFDFEELPPGNGERPFLWGAGGVAYAILLGQAWGQGDQEVSLARIEDLPAFVETIDGEARLQPAAEVLISERVASALLQRGVMPIMASRHQKMIQFLRFQSCAEPPTAL